MKKTVKKTKAKKTKSGNKAVRQWIGIDLGGTKVSAAMVRENGRIIGERKLPTELGSWVTLRAQLIRLCQELQKEHGKAISVGIGSAGPLHAADGALLDPTNFGWTAPLRVNLGKELSRALKIPVELENDAAAAVLAETWKGGGGKNCVVITLGTGLGVGVVCGGKLLRGGRGLHPEGGHMILRSGDKTAPCGCGLLGCAEAYLSGVNFARRASIMLGEGHISGADLTERANRGETRVKALFTEYSELMANYLNNIVVLYYPERVIFSGSFANAFAHFMPAAEARLKQLLERRLLTIPLMPELRVTNLGDAAGVLGAAYVAMHSHYGSADYAMQ